MATLVPSDLQLEQPSPAALHAARQKIINLASERDTTLHTVPTIAGLQNAKEAIEKLPSRLPQKGLGAIEAVESVLEDVVPGLALGQAGPRYFGFITGGTLPSAQLADFITTIYDQNAAPNRTEESICAVVESRALEFLLDLFNLPREKFPGRTLTSGATASNVMGLALARDHAISIALSTPDKPYSVSEFGFGGITINVYTDRPHSSLLKAAAISGIGRSNIIDLGKPLGVDGVIGIDLGELEKRLREDVLPGSGAAPVVSVSFGEVNTGDFTPNIRQIRALCDKYNVWLHIDAAFGAYARLVPDVVGSLADGLELGDSITSDAHKWLNVPYDCGIFFSRSVAHQRSVFGPSLIAGVPAYLAKSSLTSQSERQSSDPSLTSAYEAALSVPDPIYISIENSRRFRALPLYTALLDQGREGYAALVRRNIIFCRRLAKWMGSEEGKGYYEVLNLRKGTGAQTQDSEERTTPLNMLLFRAGVGNPIKAYHGENGSAALVKAINETRKVQVTPGQGEGAVRIAVSNWSTGMFESEGEKGDFEVVVETLKEVVEGPPEWVGAGRDRRK